MKKILLAVLASSLFGCSTSSSYRMQPDHSYEIIGSRDTVYVSSDRAKEEAFQRASVLCPKGYDVKSEFKSGMKEYTLVVMCKDEWKSVGTTN